MAVPRIASLRQEGGFCPAISLTRLEARVGAVTADQDWRGTRHREADVALRLVEPEEAGSVTRKIGTMAFGLYVRPDYAHLATPERWQFIAVD